jgi:hypothetical protein
MIYTGVTKVKYNFDNGIPKLDIKDFVEQEVVWHLYGPITFYINGILFKGMGLGWRYPYRFTIEIPGGTELNVDGVKSIFKINAKSVLTYRQKRIFLPKNCTNNIKVAQWS